MGSKRKVSKLNSFLGEVTFMLVWSCRVVLLLFLFHCYFCYYLHISTGTDLPVCEIKDISIDFLKVTKFSCCVFVK